MADSVTGQDNIYCPLQKLIESMEWFRCIAAPNAIHSFFCMICVVRTSKAAHCHITCCHICYTFGTAQPLSYSASDFHHSASQFSLSKQITWGDFSMKWHCDQNRLSTECIVVDAPSLDSRLWLVERWCFFFSSSILFRYTMNSFL